ncbi:cytidylyltransferase domain-containing protein [Escherichia coli]|uniref:acylneuraminate cytidylyltransferase family protein n=1 Tax=Escherichia coli TaxID=562 RepID=UPI00351CC2E9
MKAYAIIPARSGSKGLPNKNIREINGKPLLSYSIEFAKRLSHISKIFCSTDSEVYAGIARKYGAEVPFLRSSEAAADTAMEEHILADLRVKFAEHNIPEPDILVWLRPTFVFRSISDVEQCIEILKTNAQATAARTVVRAENRLYHLEGGVLTPAFDDLGKSMMRRQDMRPEYKVFSTDVFRFKGNNFGPDFLGRSVYAVETNSKCGLDIDDRFDFEVVKNIIENNPELVSEYL